MESAQEPSSETIECGNCKSLNPVERKFCSACSFPIGGTFDEQMSFRHTIGKRKQIIKKAEENTKTARIIIFVIAGFVCALGLYQGLVNDDFTTMIVNLSLAVLYLILAAWSNRNPFGAILTAFVVYITMNVISAFFDPATLVRGIFLKIIFIGAFIKAIRSAKDAQDQLRELEKVKAISVGDD